MKYAVIDMGSNSIRLMIATVAAGKLEAVEKHLEMTRLGLGVDAHKQLQESSMAATVAAVKKYRQMAASAGAELIGAFATSAVRDAENGPAFALRVLEETGVTVEIIPGDEEAELGYRGVLSGVGPELADERFLIIDIGGGSTELIVGDRNQIYYRESFNVGAVRMTGKHITTDPVSSDEAGALEADVASILASGLAAVRTAKPTVAIGIGGTATTFGAMALGMAVYDRERIHNARVGIEQLKRMVEQLEAMTLAEKLKLVGLMPKRADVIYAGGVVLEHLLTALNLEGFYVSDFDNLEGILAQKKIIG